MQHRLQVNGLSFNVLDLCPDAGADLAEPVLLVHGFPDDSTVWRKQIPALVAAGYRVIAPDMRGCGQSEMAPKTRDYALPNLVSDLIGILDALGIGRVKLVGHDWGAVICWAFAAAHPERITRYAALSVGHPAAYAAGPLEQKLKGWYVLMFQVRGIPEWLTKAHDWWFLRRFTAQPEEIGGWIANHARPGRLTAAINYYRANFRLLLRPDRTRVRVPVLGIYSDGDRYLAEAQMRDSASYVEAPFRFERVEGAGHWLQVEAPDAVNRLLIDFFAQEFPR